MRANALTLQEATRPRKPAGSSARNSVAVLTFFVGCRSGSGRRKTETQGAQRLCGQYTPSVMSPAFNVPVEQPGPADPFAVVNVS